MNYDFEKLAANFSRRFLKAGDVLFREGDTNGDGYIIETGELELIRNEGDTKIRTAVLGEGEVLGVWKILFANNLSNRECVSHSILTHFLDTL